MQPHWTEEERDALEQELLELEFGCHADAEALRRRIDDDPRLQELQAEVRRRAKLLEDAAHEPIGELHLTDAAPASRRGWRLLSGATWAQPWVRICAVGAAALLVVGVMGALWGLSVLSLTTAERAPLHLTVTAPRAIPAGAPATFTVATADLRRAPTPCTVTWRALDGEGRVLQGDVVQSTGSVTVAMPAALQVPQRVEVVTASGDLREQATFEILPSPSAPLVHLRTDKPVYQPGEPVWLRVVVLDRLTLRPSPRRPGVHFRIVDPKDAQAAVVYGQPCDAEGDHGLVAAAQWSIPEGAAGGEYRVEVRADDGWFPAESVPFVVRRYQPPQLAKKIVLDRKTYAPGQRGVAEVAVERLAGGIPAGAALRVALVIDGVEVWSTPGQLDHAGRAIFHFDVPEQVERGAARFVARVTDGGVVETEIEPFVVPTGEIEVALYPESGELIAGIESRVYVEATNKVGRPVEAAGTVVDDRGREVASFRSEHQGRGRFALRPEAGRRYALRLTEPSEQEFALPEPRSSGTVLQALGDAVPAGEPLRVRLLGNESGPWIVGAFCRGVLIGQTDVRPDADGNVDREVSLTLPEAAFGVLRVTVFDHALRPVAERLVQRLPARQIAVELRPDQQIVWPGAPQKVKVVTRDETGAPVPAALGVVVTDRAAVELGQEPRVGIVDQATLLADVEAPEDLEDFFLGGSAAPRNVDLVLGTRGWRRFVWRGDENALQLVQERGAWAEGLLAREGRTSAPQVLDNGEELSAGLAGHRRSVHDRRELVAGAAALGLIVLGLWIVAELFMWGARRASRAGPLLQLTTGVGAVAALLFLVVAFQPDIIGATDAVERKGVAADMDFVDDAHRVVMFGVAQADPMDAMPADPAAPAGDWGEDGVKVDLLAGAFFNDGRDGDVRARAENFFLGMGERADMALLQELGLEIPEGEARLGNLDKDNKLAAGRFLRNGERPFARVYAHRRQGGAERSDFTETVYWNPLLVTDENGQAELSFDVSDRVTTWQVQADAHGQGRLGQALAEFDARMPFHLQAKLPIEVSAGDRLRIPIALASEDAAAVEAELRIVAHGPLVLDEPGYQRAALTEGRGRYLFPITVGNPGETARLRIAGLVGRYRDFVAQELRVVPRGFPHGRSWAGTVAADEPARITLALPGDALPGSARAILKVFPSPLATMNEGLQGLLREPSGCFEQASSSNYPNVMVLSYLDASGDDIPSVATRAAALLPKGYGKIAGYECQQRGYEWFGGDPGHEALTAYGLLEFKDMARVYDVDEAMVARTRQWLLGRRDGKGGFLRNARALDSFGRAPDPVTDAYITYALLYSGTEASEIPAEVERLVQRAATTEDAYELAVIACALYEAERTEVTAARSRLRGMQEENGSLCGSTTSITSSGKRDLAVETTSFAILAWIPDEEYAASVRSAVEFVQSQKNARGTFGATQATIMALKALTEYTQKSRRMQAPGTVRVFVDDLPVIEQPFAAGHPDALVFDLLPHLGVGEHAVRVELQGGGGALPWACDLSYHAEQPADDPECKVALRTALAENKVEEGRTVALEIEVENRTAEGLPMTLAVVGLPAGLEATTEVLDDLKKGGAFDLWEIRGRELVLYWRGMAPEDKNSVTLDLVARIPGVTTGPASRAYLYYTADEKRWAAPLQVEVTAAR